MANVEGSSSARRWLPRPGAVLGEHRLERLLGRGGMAAVYLGRHLQLGVERAVKVQLLGGRADRAERFAREARSLARLQPHPGVVQIHSYAVDGDIAYMALDLVAGSDLEAALAGGPLEVTRALRIARGAAEALAHVHRAGIVHRDLKPANVLLRGDDSPVLTDFGVARDDVEARMTATHAIVGTPAFMAPEQLVPGRGDVGPATDVFALGVVLYQALTGERPFEGESFIELARAVDGDEPAPPSRLRPGLAPDVDRVVLAALAKAPAARPSAGELAAALDALLRGEPPRLRREPRARSRRRRVAALALGGAATLALVAMWITVPARAARRALEAHLAWEAAALAPWGLGVAPGAAVAPTASALDARGRDLEAARAGADAATRGELERALARLRAHARLLAGGPPREAYAAACPEDRVVDALALRARGDPKGALARLGGAAGFGPADALRLALEAEVDPRGLLHRGPPASPALAGAARAAAAVALARLVDEVARGAPTDLDAATRELARWVELARRREVDDLSAAAAAKRAGLEAAAARLEQEVERALSRRAGPELAARAARFLAAPPRVAPGPAVGAALARLHHEPLAAFVRMGVGERVAWEQLALGLRAEAALSYGVGAAAASEAPEGLARAARAVIVFDGLESVHPDAVTLLVLASLRVGVLRPGRDLVRRAGRDALARFRAEHPESRAARLADLLLAAGADELPAGDMPAALGDALEEALAQGVPDVAPVYEAEVRLFVARHRILARVGDPPGSRAPRPDDLPALRGWVEAVRRARTEMLPFDFLVFGAAEAEAGALAALGERDAAARRWREAHELFLTRSVDPGAAPVPVYPVNEDYAQGKCARALSDLLLADGRSREAEEVLRAALAHHRRVSGSRGVDTQVALAALLSRQGRHEEALEALGPDLLGTVDDAEDAAIQAVAALEALGRVEEAREALARGRQRHPRSAALERLAAGLGR